MVRFALVACLVLVCSGSALGESLLPVAAAPVEAVARVARVGRRARCVAPVAVVVPVRVSPIRVIPVAPVVIAAPVAVAPACCGCASGCAACERSKPVAARIRGFFVPRAYAATLRAQGYAAGLAAAPVPKKKAK